MKKMVADFGGMRVEFDQVKVAIPTFVAEGISELTTRREIYTLKPVAEAGGFAVLLQVAERPEVPPHMVEDSVEDDFDAVAVQLSDEVCQRLIRAEAAVHVEIIGGVVAVGGGFKQGSEVEGVDSQFAQVRNPFVNFLQPRHRHGGEVVACGRAAKSKRIDVIED